MKTKQSKLQWAQHYIGEGVDKGNYDSEEMLKLSPEELYNFALEEAEKGDIYANEQR